MDNKVIVWKLNELMARKRVRNKELAQALGISENSMYRLRKTDLMPRLSPERLNGLCTYLQCQPGDLMQWIPDDNSNKSQITTDTPLNQQHKGVEPESSQKRTNDENPNKVKEILVFPEAKESA